MPIYNWKCIQCGKQKELLMKWEESNTSEVICTACSLVMKKQVPLVAKTAGLWNGGWQEGLSNHGKFDAGLGCKIYSEKQRDDILSAKGLTRVTDLGGENFLDDKIASFDALKTKQDKLDTDMKAARIKYGDDYEKIYDEVMPGKAILAGEFDELL